MRSTTSTSELQQASERRQDFLDVVEKHAGVGHWTIQLETNDVYLSTEACRALGVRPENGPESLADFVDLYCLQDREHVSTVIVEAMRAATSFSYEARLQTPSGDVRWVSASGEVRCDDAGCAVSIVGVLRDISEDRRVRDRLRLALAEANSASRLKDTFLANMSHELRTPLNAIIGFSQLISIKAVTGEVTDQVGEYAGDIANAGAHLLTIIEDMFSLAQMEAGAANITLKPVGVGLLIDDARSLTGALARNNNTMIDFEDSGLAARKVMVDREKMTKVLVSVISNAIKFSPNNAVIRVKAKIGECDRLVFSVEDQGPGIPRHEQEKVFERFERLGACKEAVPGIGVGLAIARSLVHSMKGEIGVISKEGEGSTFWLAFDMVQPDGVALDRRRDSDRRPPARLSHAG